MKVKVLKVLGLSWLLAVQGLEPTLATPLTLKEILSSQVETDSSIPSPSEFIGVDLGSKHLLHHEIVRYLDKLATVSPKIESLGEYGKSYGGRPLMAYAISSPENIKNLQLIKSSRAKIVDPSADIDLSGQPAVLHMMYSIHGNEASGANATPLLAYYLAAVKEDYLDVQLKNVVIILSPVLNPDGLDRFASWSNNHAGSHPSDDPNDREHIEPSPNGRTNYYWFDLNRDWLPHQHPESRGLLKLFHSWKPNVQLDFHEQGSNRNFFFMPGVAERTFPLIPKVNQDLTAAITRFHEKKFDEHGTLFFTREGFDDFYVGKGSTYPDFFGCVGILFEQPSSRGVKQRVTGGELTFTDSITNQFRASLSSIEGVATLKNRLLKYQRDYYASANKRSSKKFYLASAPGDDVKLQEFIRVLRGHQIQIEALAEDKVVDGLLYKSDETIAIPADQPHSRYLQAIWGRQLDFKSEVFYDVSTWTLPLAFNLTHTERPVERVKTVPLGTDEVQSVRPFLESPIGYLIDWQSSDAASLLYGLLNAGAKVRVGKQPFVAKVKGTGAMGFSAGTLFVTPTEGKGWSTEVTSAIKKAFQEGLPIYSVASSSTPVGVDLGSSQFEVIEKPKVMVITGPGTSAYRVGEIWHLLDRRANMPITMVDKYRLPDLDYSGYTHVILTNPLKGLQDPTIEDLKAFVSAGGTVWAQGAETLEWLRANGLADIHWRETDAQRLEKKRLEFISSPPNDSSVIENYLPERKPYAAASGDAASQLVRGSILEGKLDRTHPLGFGYVSGSIPMFRRNAKFMTRSSDSYSTPILYSNKPLMSGYMSGENQRLVSNSASVIVESRGEGTIVLSLDLPAFRGFWWGTQRLLLNTIFFGKLM